MEEREDWGDADPLLGFGLEVSGGGDLVKLKNLVDTLAVARTEYDRRKAAASAANEECERLEREILGIMEAAGIERFDGELAAVTMKEKTSVKVPKSPEDKAAFFGYLREQGVFDDLATVNSATLNSWYRAELEVRRASGKSEEVPGLGSVTSYYDLSVRKK